MWKLDHKEGWVPKNWCFWTVVLEKVLESPLDSKEIKPVNLKGNQPWILIGRTDAEAPILWPPDVKNRLIGKDPDAGKDLGQEKKGITEDEMVGWHHWPNGHESVQILEDREGQRSLVCCSPWVGHDLVTEQQQAFPRVLISTICLRWGMASFSPNNTRETCIYLHLGREQKKQGQLLSGRCRVTMENRLFKMEMIWPLLVNLRLFSHLLLLRALEREELDNVKISFPSFFLSFPFFFFFFARLNCCMQNLQACFTEDASVSGIREWWWFYNLWVY